MYVKTHGSEMQCNLCGDYWKPFLHDVQQIFTNPNNSTLKFSTVCSIIISQFNIWISETLHE